MCIPVPHCGSLDPFTRSRGDQVSLGHSVLRSALWPPFEQPVTIPCMQLRSMEPRDSHQFVPMPLVSLNALPKPHFLCFVCAYSGVSLTGTTPLRHPDCYPDPPPYTHTRRSSLNHKLYSQCLSFTGVSPSILLHVIVPLLPLLCVAGSPGMGYRMEHSVPEGGLTPQCIEGCCPPESADSGSLEMPPAAMASRRRQ